MKTILENILLIGKQFQITNKALDPIRDELLEITENNQTVKRSTHSARQRGSPAARLPGKAASLKLKLRAV